MIDCASCKCCAACTSDEDCAMYNADNSDVAHNMGWTCQGSDSKMCMPDPQKGTLNHGQYNFFLQNCDIGKVVNGNTLSPVATEPALQQYKMTPPIAFSTTQTNFTNVNLQNVVTTCPSDDRQRPVTFQPDGIHVDTHHYPWSAVTQVSCEDSKWETTVRSLSAGTCVLFLPGAYFVTKPLDMSALVIVGLGFPQLVLDRLSSPSPNCSSTYRTNFETELSSSCAPTRLSATSQKPPRRLTSVRTTSRLYAWDGSSSPV